jgi:2-oxoglutarate ferredoxin oxidoreductase subunit gamma
MMGFTLAQGAMNAGYQVTFLPAYGAEVRGGTANCIVIISSARISSPIVLTFNSGILLTQPALDKFESSIKPGGLLIFEESSIINPPTRTDIECLGIPANEEAQKLKKKQVANMIILGAFLEKNPVVKIENVLSALKKVLPERHHHLIPINEQALEIGKRFAASVKAIT